MDVEPSSNRRASTLVQEDDHPELLGEEGASSPLWGICFSGAGTSQGSPVTARGSGPLTRARSRHTGIMPSPLTELRLRRDNHMPWDPPPIGTSHALSKPSMSLEAREGGGGVQSPATLPCRGAVAPQPSTLAESANSCTDPMDMSWNPGPKPVSFGGRGALGEKQLVAGGSSRLDQGMDSLDTIGNELDAATGCVADLRPPRAPRHTMSPVDKPWRHAESHWRHSMSQWRHPMSPGSRQWRPDTPDECQTRPPS
jgi:hypothetical protein